MGISENDILSKLNIVTDSYLSVTGKPKESCIGISLSDYILLREQAISEIQRGIINSNNSISFAQRPTPQHVEQSLQSPKKKMANNIEGNGTQLKEVQTIAFDDEQESKDKITTNNLADKFAKIRDM